MYKIRLCNIDGKSIVEWIYKEKKERDRVIKGKILNESILIRFLAN